MSQLPEISAVYRGMTCKVVSADWEAMKVGLIVQGGFLGDVNVSDVESFVIKAVPTRSAGAKAKAKTKPTKV